MTVRDLSHLEFKDDLIFVAFCKLTESFKDLAAFAIAIPYFAVWFVDDGVFQIVQDRVVRILNYVLFSPSLKNLL